MSTSAVPLRSVVRPDRREVVALVAVGSLALVMRLLYLHVLHERGLFFGLFLDSDYYAGQAARIRTGLGVGDHPYLFSPLYPYFLALFTNSGGELAARSVQFAQAIVGSATAIVTALAGRRIAGRSTGIVAGVVVALHGPFLHLDSLLLVASLQTFFFTLALWLVLAAGGSWRSWLAVGLALGTSVVLRPTGLTIVATLACVLVARGRRWWLAVALLVGTALLIAPFTLRNLVQTGEPVLLSANAGVNFWIGNHSGANGLYGLPSGTDFVHDRLSKQRAERALGQPLTYREASRWWSARAFHEIREEPVSWVRLMARKALYFLHPEEIAQLGSGFRWYRERAWPLWLPLDARWLFVLAFAFVFVRRSFSGPAVSWLLCFVIPYSVGICLFFVTGRHRSPIMPAVIILASAAAIGLIGAFARAGERRRRVAAACGLVSVALLGLASHGLYDRRGAPFYVSELTGMEERHRGMARFDDGRYEEAAVAFREALAVQDDPITRTNLGNALQAAGRFDEAAMEYERSLQMNRGSALTWYNYGILLMKFPERLGQAEQSLGEAIRRAPRMPGAHLRLGEVYLRAGRPRAAVPALERSLELTGADEAVRARARELLTIARSRIEENDVPAD